MPFSSGYDGVSMCSIKVKRVYDLFGSEFGIGKVSCKRYPTGLFGSRVVIERVAESPRWLGGAYIVVRMSRPSDLLRVSAS